MKRIILFIALLLGACVPVQTALPTATVSAGESIQSMIDSGQKYIVVNAGTYNEQLRFLNGGVTLIANGEVIVKEIYVPSSNNVVRGFTITDKGANNGIQVSGNYNLFENNEIYHTGQDGIWFFGHDNTFRGNYIHDILDPSIASQFPAYDEHADCFQTWDWSWDTYNVLFDGNICDHNRAEGSNQIVMVSGSRVHDLTFRNNRFIMRDAGYSPIALYGGSNYVIESNYICNSTGKGQSALYVSGAKSVSAKGNIWTGYDVLGMGSFIDNGNIRGSLPCSIFQATATPTLTRTPVPTKTATPTATITSTKTPDYSNCLPVFIGGEYRGNWCPKQGE